MLLSAAGMTRSLTFILFAIAAGCAGEKTPVTDSFDDLAGLDQKSDKFGGKLRKSIELSFRRAKFECGVLSLHIAKFTQSFAELLLE